MSQPLRNMSLLAAAVCGAFAVAACNSDDPATDAAITDAYVKAAWVEMGPDNAILVRAASSHPSQCPLVEIDGQGRRMSLRAAAGTPAQRTTASPAEDAKASVFPVSSCEITAPAGTTRLSIGGHALPVPKANPQRVVILADTGCRMKKADNAWQACSDASAWPFETIAKAAAALKPDLVLHIGDYHYRENACPPDVAGCQGSPWGYGWDTWEADLFKPAAKLLAAAPWVMVRGNHEECARGGQGWQRFLDTSAFSAARSCDDPANDGIANYTDPYAVSIGGDTQVIVFDSAKTGKTALRSTDAQFITYQAQFRKAADLAARPGVNSLWANHHPILAFAPIAGAAPAGGNAALLSVGDATYPTAYYPAGIKLAIHGHVHDFQAINFSSNHPAAIVSGNGGDNLDVNLPDPFPANTNPAPGAVVDAISHTSTFGFLVMDRSGSNWVYKAMTKDGKLLATCTQSGQRLLCDKTGYLAP
ncbi:metallophosphoesterase family protein [Derxia gummosa]|uniref:Metallophosphoesterase family protein n=1 Tax=Derxia gummosa DSM 723 TaxID=1121388 RepID=A0A8B6X1N1_9BURK|nr:metallophosphoesterase [Derxia gummosa]